MKNECLLIFVLCCLSCHFNASDDIKEVPTVLLSGIISDCENGLGIPDVKVEMHKYQRSEGFILPTYSELGIAGITYTDSNGEYRLELEKENEPRISYLPKAFSDKYTDKVILSYGSGNRQEFSLKPLSWIRLKLINQNNDSTLIHKGHLSYPIEEVYDLDCRSHRTSFEGEENESIQELIVEGIGDETGIVKWGFRMSGEFMIHEGPKDTLYLPKHDTVYLEIIY